METCRMCGARLTDENERERHDQVMHPNVTAKPGGKKGGELDHERKEDRDRPIGPAR